jgi:3-oxoacyl-[acyl-carrier protein] reductase
MSGSGRLEGKVALVTGAGFGLGEGIARKFVAEGAKVLVLDIDLQNAQRVTDSLPKESAVVFHGDVTQVEDWTKAVNVCIEKLGGLHIVVNNAGVVHRSEVSKYITSVSVKSLDLENG